MLGNRFMPPGKKDSRRLSILIIHQNFPSQYLHIARYYAADPRCEVMVLTQAGNHTALTAVPGVTVCAYAAPPPVGPECGLLALDYERQVRRGLCVSAALRGIRERGFRPDVILTHTAWGEGLFIKTVFPDTPILAYAETYSRHDDPILDFDPEFRVETRTRPLVLAQNAGSAQVLAEADLIQTPTKFQMGQLPKLFRIKAILLHDGVDTDEAVRDPRAALVLPPSKDAFCDDFLPLPDFVPPRPTSLRLTARDEVISFVCRTLEPHLGWHAFVRALPLIQRRHPRVQCVVIGRTKGGYGPPPQSGRDGGSNWRDIFLEEHRKDLDFSRLHLVGNLPRGEVLKLLSITRAHVYLPYPFWLSYSPVEAMSCGAPLVAAATEPVLELVEHERDGLLVDFHAPASIADAVSRLLEGPELRAALGREARKKAIARYDSKRLWLPCWDHFIRTLAAGKRTQTL